MSNIKSCAFFAGLFVAFFSCFAIWFWFSEWAVYNDTAATIILLVAIVALLGGLAIWLKSSDRKDHKVMLQNISEMELRHQRHTKVWARKCAWMVAESNAAWREGGSAPGGMAYQMVKNDADKSILPTLMEMTFDELQAVKDSFFFDNEDDFFTPRS